jgi:hypothetical protein
MKIKEPKNQNYAAIVVEIKTLIPLEKCDNVCGAIIMGNQVVVSKDVKVGDIGLYFPLECALSKEYLSNNNLYRKPELNVDPKQKGYFEENGRIRCVRFRGHKSEGLFMPLISLEFIYKNSSNYSNTPIFEYNTTFDELEGTPICSKYVVKTNRTPGQPGSKKTRDTKKYESKLVENQFRFHQDTSMLYRNLHRIEPNSLISCTYKLHGTSGISSYVLCKQPITKLSKFKEWCWEFTNKVENLFRSSKYHFRLDDTKYDYIYSSRKVIKNEELNPNAQHFYNEDIWGIAHNEVKDFLQKGMTFYYEIVGFLPNGGSIQKDYDYGCEPTKHAVYIYRITSTNVDGKVIEFSAKQVQDFCKKNGLNAVPELYYGYAKDLFPYVNSDGDNITLDENWSEVFLNWIKSKYNEKDCYMCLNPLPEEGVVIRVEGTDFEAFKAKSERFYTRETAQLDKGESNIEDEN